LFRLGGRKEQLMIGAFLRTGLLAALIGSVAAASASAQPAGNPLDRFLKDGASSFVLENLRLIDGTGAPAREGVTLVIEGGRIASIGSTPARLPSGARRVDLAGHTVTPGLVMMHEHINYFSAGSTWNAMPYSVPKLLLAAGVTSIRTAGSEAPQVDIALKKRLDAGRAPGPHLSVTGGYLNAESGGFLGDTVTETAEQAARAVAYWGGLGATSVKVYSAISPAALKGAVDEANKRGMHIAGHLGEISCTEAAKAGIHTIEHGLTSCFKDLGIAPEQFGTYRYDTSDPRAKALIALLVRKKIAIVSTPDVTMIYDRDPEALTMLTEDRREHMRALLANPPSFLLPKPQIASWEAAHRAFERDFVAAGGLLLIGGDASDFGAVPGYANHVGMIELVKAGFSPLQVIRMATADGAGFLKLDDRGTIAVGKAADLLVVAGAPDRRMEDIRNVRWVFRGGRAFDPVKLRDASKGQLGRR
jgi:imidazolonepropionase-like amidohydrolase